MLNLLFIHYSQFQPVEIFITAELQTKVRAMFDVHVTVHRDKFIIIIQLDALISQIYFG